MDELQHKVFLLITRVDTNSRQELCYVGIVGIVQDDIEDGVCEGFPSVLYARVAFVGTDTEAGIQPKDAGFGEGRA